MKTILSSSKYSFEPASGRIDFASFPAFNISNLYAILNITAANQPVIYAVGGDSAVGGTYSGTRLNFNYDVSAMSSGDNIMVIYDDLAADEYTFTSTAVGNTAVNNLLTAGSAATDVTGFRSFVIQIIANASSSGTVTFEGSNDNTNFVTIPVQASNNTAGELIVTSATVSASTSVIYSAPINFNYLRLRNTAFGVGSSVQCFVKFSQTVLNNEIQPVQLIGRQGQTASYGLGATVDGNTLRVTQATDSPTNIFDSVITGPAGVTTLNNNALTNSATSTDANGFRSFSVQIVGSAGIAAGAIQFECSNDNTNFVALPYYNFSTTTPTIGASTQAIAASSNTIYVGAIIGRYFRVRVSTGFTGGSITATARLMPTPFQIPVLAVSGTVNASISGASSGIGIGLQTFTTTEVASSAISSSANTTAATISNFQSTNFIIAVTAVSGTTPTYDISVEESADNGTNWNVRYQFPRITTTGLYRSPQLNLNGVTRTRLVQTIGGTTPSFTRAITRNNANTQDSDIRQLIDRTIVATTLNSTSPTLFLGICENIQLTIVTGAATVPAIYTVDVSHDGTNWNDLALALTGTASTTVRSAVVNVQGLFARVRVSTAGTTVTQDQVVLRAWE